jgi:BirA family transcriptional regulator, biotin operon repressor / biotin---[acetyl-CoA-carboxylase] ligase
MISIPLIRRELTSDILGRHIYLFGAGSATTEILRRLAEAGAQEGTVVLSEDEGERVSAAVLFRPHLALGAVPLFSAIPTLALAEAITDDKVCATPAWPDRVAVEGETVARGVVETAPSGDRQGYIILGADIDVPALEAARGRSIDWNVVIAAFLNTLDKWTTAYAARGPAAVRGALRFLPRGRTTIAGGAEWALATR